MASAAKLKSWLRFIQQVGVEQGFEIEGGESMVRIVIEAHHGVAYRVQINSAGYLQAQQWECDSKGKKGRYGRAVFSMRSNSDVAQFCSVLIASSALRARRREDDDA
ncbi:hypothetical protein [Cognatilysobacter bugurensis]|uniref:Uncharacterized protein n=1 Tax=Cognatilysobacter bugurensis TaxID=543356 RepID=A0A918T1B4_9GAMM|nr:hypothetical protein [Lysobacter bugurensis]GHA83870.1 hypothetical protein GCM10007067_22510 [Lysobacter bugurensis]